MNQVVFTQGDTPSIELVALDDQGVPVNLTGAVFLSEIQGPNSVGPISFADGQHDIVDAAAGIYTLNLTANDTEACGVGYNKDLITQATIGGAIATFRYQGILDIYPAIPLQ